MAEEKIHSGKVVGLRILAFIVGFIALLVAIKFILGY